MSHPTDLAPQFPPLFHGLGLSGTADPFAKAQAQATIGCDAGLVTYNFAADQMRAAMVFAPEVPLNAAMAVHIACGIGLQNALGALAPPEVSVQLGWPGQIYVNGATCGHLQVAAASTETDKVPPWIVVGLQIPIIPEAPDAPGIHPDQTCLYEEGCADILPQDLVSAWARHSLLWINRLQDDGLKPLNSEWSGLAHDLGQEVSWDIHGTRHTGVFVGVDETFGALLRHPSETNTRLLPLTTLLEGNT